MREAICTEGGMPIMRYGFELPIDRECADPRVLAELAVLAEAAGWDGVFLEDYIVHQSARDAPTCDPWVSLAAMAMRTERIKLGTEVTPPSRRRPWKLAREVLTLDHLSSGRMVLGVGVGDVNEPGFGAVGEVTDAKQRAAMLDEALAIIAGLWTGEPFSYHGKHYHVENLTFLPPPMQQPRVPIWVGGGWPLKGPVSRAARWDGACLYKETHGGPWEDMMPDDVRALQAAIASQRESSVPFDIVVGGRTRGDDWELERAHIQSLAEAGATWWVEYVNQELGGLDGMRTVIEAGPLRPK
jgi:alkanesulfonate monooxygenase SsuD/methylene tetrahydromethanopterin reductase-like flavin-dependent oxidoreductase (luciferase family)